MEDEQKELKDLQVAEELKMLNDLIESTISLVVTLYERLQAVLISDEVKDDGTIKQPKEICVLAMQIRDARFHTHQIYDYVMNMLDRLQL